MRLLNRVLTVLIFGVGVTLGWAWLARTDWAATVSALGVGEGFDHPLEPIIKLGAAVLIMVSATKLVQRAWEYVWLGVLGKQPRRARPRAVPRSTGMREASRENHGTQGSGAAGLHRGGRRAA